MRLFGRINVSSGRLFRGISKAFKPGRPVVVLPGRYHPFQLVTLTLCTWAGVAFFLRGPPTTDPLAKQLSPAALSLWSLLLCMAGMVGLWGSFTRRRPLKGLIAERNAMLILLLAMGVYIGAAFAARAPEAPAVAASLAVWCAGIVHRLVQLQRALKVLR